MTTETRADDELDLRMVALRAKGLTWEKIGKSARMRKERAKWRVLAILRDYEASEA
jgi:hypothetical protein